MILHTADIEFLQAATLSGNISKEDEEYIEATMREIKTISTYYPLFLYGFGIPTNFVTIRILQSSPSLRRNFVSMFLIYLSFYNVLNTLIGLSQFWFYGMFGYEIGSFTPVFSRANLWCGRGVTHMVMVMILFGTTFFHVAITDGGKKVSLSENIPQFKQDHYLFFSKTRAWAQTCFFFYIPSCIIISVNFTIVFLYSRTLRLMREVTKSFRRHLNVAHNFAIITLLCDIQIIIMEFPYAYFYTEGHAWRKQGPVAEAKANMFYCVAVMMLYTNYSINFIVYCFFGNYYRRELLRIFRPCLDRFWEFDERWLNSSDSEDTEFTYESGSRTIRTTVSLKNLFHDYSDQRNSRHSLPIMGYRKSSHSSPVDYHADMKKSLNVRDKQYDALSVDTMKKAPSRSLQTSF